MLVAVIIAVVTVTITPIIAVVIVAPLITPVVVAVILLVEMRGSPDILRDLLVGLVSICPLFHHHEQVLDRFRPLMEQLSPKGVMIAEALDKRRDGLIVVDVGDGYPCLRATLSWFIFPSRDGSLALMAKIAPPKPGGNARNSSSYGLVMARVEPVDLVLFLRDGRERIPTNLPNIHHVNDGGRVADLR
jgi:hypothetical protein